jgi:predicted transposase YbfD/YdcC
MPTKPSGCIQEYFAELTDPRRREGIYPLINIVTIAICAVICGADDFVAIAKFGRVKQKWLSRFLDLKDGIPSHDRFNAILAAIKPAEFEACLLSWITALHEITGGQLVAIDGKTLRRSFDAASSKSAIHMVSAWATANHISLGQVTVNEKSNEITAIPKLLKMLEIAGSLVTIDAMGCQTEIAKTIIESEADYVLAVKKNQPTLYDGISWFFLTRREENFAGVRVSRHQTHEKGHGREETRWYYVCSVPRDLPDRKRWPKLAAIGWTINETMRDGRRCYEMRYYIMSRKLSAKEFAAAVRGHWSIENSLHWQLDVTFGEDQSRLRRGHADTNFSILRRTALSLLKNNKTLKVGVKNKRLTAGWDDSYLQQVLFRQ